MQARAYALMHACMPANAHTHTHTHSKKTCEHLHINTQDTHKVFNQSDKRGGGGGGKKTINKATQHHQGVMRQGDSTIIGDSMIMNHPQNIQCYR